MYGLVGFLKRHHCHISSNNDHQCAALKLLSAVLYWHVSLFFPLCCFLLETRNLL